MKVWELEEGKVYVCGSDNYKYKIENEKLMQKISNVACFEGTYLTYNAIMNCNFTEYIEPVDWSKVKVDTKVVVDSDSGIMRRHFSHFENGKVYTFDDGRTSFTTSKTRSRDSSEVSLYKEPTEEVEQKPTEKQTTISVPYEVGDSIFYIQNNNIREYKINRIENVSIEVLPVEHIGYENALISFHSRNTAEIFTTREEAENKLKERMGE